MLHLAMRHNNHIPSNIIKQLDEKYEIKDLEANKNENNKKYLISQTVI